MNAFISYAPGTVVERGGKRCVITHHLDLETILVKDQETGKSEQARLSEIKPISNITEIERKQGLELSLIDQEDWNDVEGWVEKLRPLLSEPNLSVEMVKKVAIEAEVHISTIYRKLALLREAGRASVLTTGKSDGGKHKSRLAPDVEATIESTIDDFHFNKQKKKRSKKETIEEIKRRLRNAKLTPPHDNTLYNRITTAIRKKKNGLTKKVTCPESLRRKAVRLWMKGYSQVHVAKKLSVHQTTVSLWVKKHRVSPHVLARDNIQ